MGLWDKIETVDATRDGGNYVKPGDYLVKINRIKTGKNRKGEDFLAVEMQVCHNYNPLVNDQEHRVGEDVTHLLMARHDPFLPNCKALVSVLMDCDPTEITKDHMDAVCCDDQPLGGLVAHIVAKHTPTKRGGIFTRVTYKRVIPVDELRRTLSEPAILRCFSGGTDLDVMAEREKLLNQ